MLSFLKYVVLASIIFNSGVTPQMTQRFRAVRGKDAVLTCGEATVYLDGPKAYVVWIKDYKHFVYRYPSLETINNMLFDDPPCQDTEYGCIDGTSLVIRNVEEKDGGIYRCRIHYQGSPSVDFAAALEIVEPPGDPVIYTEYSYHVNGNYVEPLALGQNSTIYCKVHDDRRSTRVYWTLGGEKIETLKYYENGTITVILEIKNASRSHLGREYACEVQAGDVTPPLRVTFKVIMYLPPLKVEIRANQKEKFVAGEPQLFDCLAIGCYPSPTVEWYLDGKLLRPSIHKEVNDGNFTVSTLSLVLKEQDDKKDLTCKVKNNILNKEYTSTYPLKVGYRPKCQLPDNVVIGVVEGQEENTTCMVRSYPGPTQFTWVFADTSQVHSFPEKLPGFADIYKSILTWSPRQRDLNGVYCFATNEFGPQNTYCSFTVVQGGPPSTPNCTVTKLLPNMLKAYCRNTWNGGRSQTIHMELIDMDNNNVLSNTTSFNGDFLVRRVNYELNLSANFYATSIRGRSSSLVISLNRNESKIGDKNSLESHPINWWKWGEVATFALLVVCLLCAIIRYFSTKNHTRYTTSDSSHTPDGTFHREPEFEERPNYPFNRERDAPSSQPMCRVLVGCGAVIPVSAPNPDINHYYV